MVPRQCGLPGSVTLSTREWGADPYGPSLCGGCLAWRYTSRQGGGWKVRATSWAVSPPNCGAESCPKSGHYQDLSRVSFEECMCAKSLQSCLTLCSPMDCSLPGSSVQGILQARILEWVAMPSSRGSSRPGARTRVSCVSCIGTWVLYPYGLLDNTFDHFSCLFPAPWLSISPFLFPFSSHFSRRDWEGGSAHMHVNQRHLLKG